LELPGVDIDKDVEIKVEEDMLDISGETRSDREYREEGAHITERSFGSFQRRILLPDGVDPDAIEASYEAGILNVTVPLPEPKVAATKTIPVKAATK
jgi:HSP20 family protein